MALHRILRAFNIRPLRQCFNHLHLPFPSWRCLLRHLGLVNIRVWLLLHSLVRRRTRLRLPNLWRSLLYHQVPRSREMDPRASMVDRVVESPRSDCRGCLIGVWMRPITVGCSCDGK